MFCIDHLQRQDFIVNSLIYDIPDKSTDQDEKIESLNEDAKKRTMTLVSLANVQNSLLPKDLEKILD